MSQTLDTTSIEEIDVPPAEPMIPVSEIFRALGRVAVVGTTLAIRGAIRGTVLACQGAGMLAANTRHRRQAHPTLDNVARAVDASPDAGAALRALAGMAEWEIPVPEAAAIECRARALVATNDKAGVAVLARQLVCARQERLRAQLIPIVADVCRAIGFPPRTIFAADGLIAAGSPAGAQRLAIEVAKTREGGVKIHAHTEGFADNSCEQVLDSFLAGLSAAGVRCRIAGRAPRRERPAFDWRRLDRGARLQLGG